MSDADALFNPKQFDRGYYAAIGDHLGERYLDYGFTKGTADEVDSRRRCRVVGVDISPRFV